MLDRETPQFVAVAPRWIDCHREMIVACAERGAHVFCEKPLAPTLADCDAIVAACERSHVKLAMAFQTRYSPRFARVRELIASGAIGEVLELRGARQGGPQGRRRGPVRPRLAHHGPVPRPAGRRRVVLRAGDRGGPARGTRRGPPGGRGARAAGRRPDRRDVRLRRLPGPSPTSPPPAPGSPGGGSACRSSARRGASSCGPAAGPRPSSRGTRPGPGRRPTPAGSRSPAPARASPRPCRRTAWSRGTRRSWPT
jgi:hypothetical protein